MAEAETGHHSPVLLSIRLLPEEVTLWGSDASQRLLVLALRLPAIVEGVIERPGDIDHFKFKVESGHSSRLEQDVTSMVRFSVSDPEVARVDESGKLLALADGETPGSLAGRIGASHG